VPEVGHRVWSVVFDPSGSRLVACCNDRTARLWDVADARELVTLTGHADAYSTIRAGMGGVIDAAFSHDGQLLATGGADGAVLVWDVPSVLAAASGAPVEAPPQPLLVLDAHDDAIYGMDFAPGDLRLATSSDDGTTKVWDLSAGPAQGQALLAISTGSAVTFSPDGTRLATIGQEGVARIWDAATGCELFGLYGHSGGGQRAAFGPDGTWLVTTSEDKTAKLWDLSPARELLTLVPGGAPTYSPDGKWLATGDIGGGLAGGGTGDVIIWDSGSGQPLLTLSGHVGRTDAVAFSSDGTRLVTANDDGVGKVWDTTSGQELLTISGCEVVAGYYDFGAWVSSLSPDGTRLATACVDGTVRVRDTGTGEELLSFQAHDIDTHAARFSPDGKRLATSGWYDPAVKLWDAGTGQLLYTISGTHAFLGIGFSPDGTRLAAGDRDGVVTVWDISSGQPREVQVLRGHTGVIADLAFSPDGTRLVTASTDKTARLWDLADGRELLTLALHTDIVVYIAFSPDGKRLATASPDGTTRVYALELEELVALARERVTRSLTDAECRKYLHVEVCPP
jgi:WD40 repeat protein